MAPGRHQPEPMVTAIPAAPVPFAPSANARTSAMFGGRPARIRRSPVGAAVEPVHISAPVTTAPGIGADNVPGNAPARPVMVAPQGQRYARLACGHVVLMGAARAVMGGPAACFTCNGGMGMPTVIVGL